MGRQGTATTLFLLALGQGLGMVASSLFASLRQSFVIIGAAPPASGQPAMEKIKRTGGVGLP